MAKYFVTGCAGFIGSKVCQKLLDRGDCVIGVDNLNDYYDVDLKKWRLEHILGRYSEFTFQLADITSTEDISVIFSENNFEAVLNLAARAGVRASVAEPWLYYETNLKGTLNLLEMCVKAEVKKFVLSSTSSAYGTNTIPFNENDNSDTALSPYAASKKAAEVLCHTYHYLYGIDMSILRYFTVYGPAGRPDMAYYKFIQKISRGEPIEVFGDGKQLRDFTFIDDIADGTVRALMPVGFEVINLGNNNTVPLNYVIGLIEDELGIKAKITYTERHPADVEATWAEIQKAERILSWKPQTGIEDGIRQTVQWFKSNLVNPKSIIS